MKEITCELAFSEELLAKLNEQMDEFGQISFNDCEDALVEVMPIEQKNFISEIQPVISIVLNFASEIAMGLLVSWLYDMAKEKKILVIAGHNITVDSKEDIEKAIEEISHE